MKSYKINCNSFGCVSFFLLFGLLFVPLGVYFEKLAAETYEQSIMYDGSEIDESSSCVITEGNSGSTCEVCFMSLQTLTMLFQYLNFFVLLDFLYFRWGCHGTDVRVLRNPQVLPESPHVHEKSKLRTIDGRKFGLWRCIFGLLSTDNEWLYLTESLRLDREHVFQRYVIRQNPKSSLIHSFCLIAYITIDVVEFDSSDSSVEMDTEGIAWSADMSQKFQQVYGFKYALVTDTSLSCSDVLGESSCESYYDSSTDETYYYYYPDNDSVQYLYETYDDIISPIKGVTDEHFINWMTTAGLPRFRKLYGKIDQDITAGTTWTFNMTLNFEVRSYGASKSLVLTNLASDDISVSRRAMKGLGYLYLAVGAWSLSVGFLLALYLVAKASY